MATKIHGKRPHRKQIQAMKGKTKRDPRYRPGISWETRLARRAREAAKAAKLGRSVGYNK